MLLLILSFLIYFILNIELFYTSLNIIKYKINRGYYMNHSFVYEILNYTNQDVDRLLKKFIPHLIENANTQKSTLDSVSSFKVNFKGSSLFLELEVVSNSATLQLGKAIHGGLGNTFGKGRVV